MLAHRSLFDGVDQFVKVYESKKIELAQLEQEIENKKTERAKLIENMALLEEVRVFLQELAEVTRDEMMKGLQDVVTLCLQSVFGPDIHFEIEVTTTRNNTAIEFYVVDQSGEKIVRRKPENSMGGGVLDAVSIGLRFGLLKLLDPYPIGPLFLDEPAKMVSGDRIDMIGRLLTSLTPIFGKQIIMITHHVALMDIVENAIYIRREKGVSVCETGYDTAAVLREIEDSHLQAATGGE